MGPGGDTAFDLRPTGDLTIEGLLTENSDISAKIDLSVLDPEVVLATLLDLPISEWSYSDAPGVRHVGPMAQDFYAAFGLGADETGIATLDTSGVALASIQALAAENEALADGNHALAAEMMLHRLLLALVAAGGLALLVRSRRRAQAHI